MFYAHKSKTNCQNGDIFSFLPGAAILVIKISGHSAKTTKCLYILCRLPHCVIVILHMGLTLSPRWIHLVPFKCWQPPVRSQGVPFHCGGPGSVSGQFMWDFSLMKWHQDRFLSKYFSFPLPFYFSQCSMMHTCSFIYR